MFLNGVFRRFRAKEVRKLETGAEFQRTMDEILSKLKVGDEIKNPQGDLCGVFLGKVTFPAKKGFSSKKEFYVIVAPENLKKSGKDICCSFSEANKLVGGLKKWYGADGASVYSDRNLFSGLDDKGFLNKWVIPSLEIVTGYDGKLNLVNKKANMEAQAETGWFKKVFAEDFREDLLKTFWTCTQSLTPVHAKDHRAASVMGTDLVLFLDIKNPQARAYVRPCRFVPAQGAGPK